MPADEPTDDVDELTGARTEDVEASADEILEELFAVIEDRKRTLPEDSYTASLFTHEKGENAVLEKLGEETTELVLAAKDDDHDELAHESADIVYHLLVLLAMKDVPLDALREELASRR
jgi:phosphoribosyl-ATP pyrophosphohydrolase